MTALAGPGSRGGLRGGGQRELVWLVKAGPEGRIGPGGRGLRDGGGASQGRGEASGRVSQEGQRGWAGPGMTDRTGSGCRWLGGVAARWSPAGGEHKDRPRDRGGITGSSRSGEEGRDAGRRWCSMSDEAGGATWNKDRL